MEQVFGAVGPFTIMVVISLLTQWTKNNFTLSGKQVQFVALGFALVLITAFQLLTAPITPFGIFSGVIYSLLGWFSAIGMYEVANKQLGRG